MDRTFDEKGKHGNSICKDEKVIRQCIIGVIFNSSFEQAILNL